MKIKKLIFIKNDSEIDIIKINTLQLNYQNKTLKKANSDYQWWSAPLKKISKKNCDSESFHLKLFKQQVKIFLLV
jgi:hypothetical protein